MYFFICSESTQSSQQIKKQLSSADYSEANKYAILVKNARHCELQALPGYKNAFEIITEVHFYLFTSGVLHDEFLLAYTSTVVKLF